MICKGAILDQYGQTPNHGKRRIRDLIHIISIEPLINGIIENFHIKGMNRFFNIIYDGLAMS